MKIRYFGHSAFEIETEGKKILLDPFISGNPSTNVDPADLNPDYILLSHGHGDHLGDAVEISKNSGAVIVAPYELGIYCERKGASVHTMHIGGNFTFDFGEVKMVQANHGSGIVEENDVLYGGNPCGFIFTIEGNKFYFAGDTGLFGDMELFGRYYGIDVAMLPIGGNYTMDVRDALIAVEMLKPKKVIPMHFNTFDLIRADLNEFFEKCSAKGVEPVKIDYDSDVNL